MLKIELIGHKLERLPSPSLSDQKLTEVHDLQQLIFNNPNEFFGEMGHDKKLFLIGKEVLPSQKVQDRIDILAIDTDGTAVIIELKRGNNKLQLLQAISYAGMIAKWGPQDFLAQLSSDKREQLDEFLDGEIEDINRQQGIILIAEAFDYSVLVGAEWLSEHYDLDIRCCRVALAADVQTKAKYLCCSNVYPNPDLAEQAVPRGKKTGSGGGILDNYPNWDAALGEISNSSVVDFFKKELAAKRECYLPHRILRFRINGKRKFNVSARQKNAYVWQRERFEGDVAFWKAGLSDPSTVQVVKDGRCLRFYLTQKVDFDFFYQKVTQDMTNVAWQIPINGELAEVDDETGQPE